MEKIIIDDKCLIQYSDEYFMKYAIDQARNALDYNEVPIGSIIVGPENEIIGMGFNKVESEFSQSRHAEVIAIEQAGQNLVDWRLQLCTIYVTVEPCMMCLSLIGLSRLKRLVYGANSPLFGCHLDIGLIPELYLKHITEITGGVLKDEAALLLKSFFKQKRKKGE